MENLELFGLGCISLGCRFGLNTGYSRQLATEHPERNEDNLKNKDDLKK